MDIESIINWIFVLFLTVCIVVVPIITGINYHYKDIYRKELVLNCNNNLECIKLIIGNDKCGY